ncbi:endolytic transglycosylase MltG [Marinimicrobium sp. C2-29]|uniref:endolytic transglycosylase MltG n=1 Tax=Marinimicrobium sp. C2-29 TaxID=3139825 RepID=UPI00313880A5
MKRLMVGLFVLVLATAGGGLVYSYQWLHEPLELPEGGMFYELKRGKSLGHITNGLAREGVLEHPRLLRLYARITGQSRVHAGEYRLAPGLSPKGLLDKLTAGDVVMHRVTLVEGWTYAQALEVLHAQENIEPRLEGLSQAQQLAQLEIEVEHPEGWFFPDTYRYVKGTSDVEILRRAHALMRAELERLWPERAQGLPYDTPYEALIMASLIERETGASWERDRIAGVFVRRLEQGMRLQTDPTVIYGMGERYQGRITRSDLRQATPYNTYTIPALPPTPIALPGREALAAALNPADGTALYFVAKGDGTHVFSDTLEEHNRAVREYQLRRREDYRSTPPPAP